MRYVTWCIGAAFETTVRTKFCSLLLACFIALLKKKYTFGLSEDKTGSKFKARKHEKSGNNEDVVHKVEASIQKKKDDDVRAGKSADEKKMWAYSTFQFLKCSFLTQHSLHYLKLVVQHNFVKMLYTNANCT